MFGCCVAGRLLQTNVVQVDDTHAYFELPNASSINHVCVFLLGTIPFPDGFGATVHFFWPGKGFQLLGMLSNEKPSAIFRLRGSFSSSSASATQDRFSISSAQPSTTQDVTAILGISIEPLAQIQYQIASLQASTGSGALVPSSSRPDLATQPGLLAERIVKHLINYVSSFVGSGVGPDVVLPMSVIIKWYETFSSKLKAGGVGFLEREE